MVSKPFLSDTGVKLYLNSYFYDTDDVELFNGIHHNKLVSLFKNVKSRTYPAGSIIFRPQESLCENLFYLERGRVEMYRITLEGKRLVTRQILSGSIFGIKGLLMGQFNQKNFAEAVEDSSVGIITRQEFMNTLKTQPEIMLHITEILCNRVMINFGEKLNYG